MDSALTTVGLPLALAIIMFGLGLDLTVGDFRRVGRAPKAVAVALGCQVVLLPAICFGLVVLFDLPALLGIGMLLLAASPGGTTANLFSHLFRGDVALNITLTAVNSVLSLITLPLIVNFSLEHFLGEGRSIPLQFSKVMQVVAVVLVPVAIGMLIRSRKPSIADRLDKPVRIISAVFLVLVVGSAIAKERANLGEFFQQVGLAALAFNVASMAVGYVVPRLFRVEAKQAVAIGMEIGIHNGTLAIAIASSPSLLNDPVMAIPPAIYSLIMFVTAAVFGIVAARQARRADL